MERDFERGQSLPPVETGGGKSSRRLRSQGSGGSVGAGRQSSQFVPAIVEEYPFASKQEISNRRNQTRGVSGKEGEVNRFCSNNERENKEPRRLRPQRSHTQERLGLQASRKQRAARTTGISKPKPATIAVRVSGF